MASEPTSSLPPARTRPSWPVWLDSKAFWAGVSIVTMWLVVLFVAIFGGNIYSSTPGGSSTSVPVVVVLIPFVLAGTVVVGRRGFRADRVQYAAQEPRPSTEERRPGSDEPVSTRSGPRSRAA